MSTTKPGLGNQLQDRAIEFVRTAAAELLNARCHHFAVAIGTAIELLSKAVLVGLHPSAIADRDFDSLLLILGHGNFAKPKAYQKTISGREALDRCTQVLPKLKSILAPLHEIVDLRNGTLHLGEAGEQAALSGYVSAFLEFSELVCNHLSLDQQKLFAGHLDLFKKIRDAHGSEVAQRVARKIAKAKRIFKVRFANVASKDLPKAAGIHKPHTVEYGDEEVQLACPACGQPVQVSCFKEVSSEYNEDGTRDVTLSPSHMCCGFCSLELEDNDEALEAGLPEEIEGEPEECDDDPTFEKY